MRTGRTGIAQAVAAALLSAVGAQALAQSSGLEEMVVTAQRREQSLQEAPLAITAFGAEALEQHGVTDVEELAGFVPNVQIAATPGSASAVTVAIRGSVTFNPAITWEPTVGMYLDGVFIGKNLGGIFDVADLERVEVLRGPQGSLYGKNTVGGAVNLVSREPSGEFGGKLLGGVGNEGYYRVYGSMDTPALGTVGEGLGQFSANITLQHEQRDGFVRNVADPVGSPLVVRSGGDDLEDLDADSGRIALVLDVTENFEARYSYDFSQKDQNTSASVLTHVEAGVLPYLVPYLGPEDERPDSLSSDQDTFEDTDISGHALHLSYGLGEVGALADVTLKSITSYRELELHDFIDLDGSPVDVWHSERKLDYEQFSQEFQVVGVTERVNYVIGLYYFEEEADMDNPNTMFGVFGFPTSPNAYGLEGESRAVFGQIDWRPGAAMLADRLTVTVGGRYTEEEKDQYIAHPLVIDWSTYQMRPELAFAGQADDDWSNFSPAVTLSWEFTDSLNAYVRYAKGWKSGGFNGEADTLASFERGYDAEEVASYELGLKSRWLENRLQINAAVFENEVEDMQVSVFLVETASSVVSNAGKATIRGFELEMLAEPVDELQLNFNWGYLDPEYDEYMLDGGVDASDYRDFPYTPQNTLNAGVQYTWTGLGCCGDLIARLDWSYVDDRVAYLEPEQNRHSQLDDYAVFSARLTMAEIPVGNGSLKVSAWGKNLLDEDYRLNTIPFLIWTASYFGDPRTYGMDFSYEF